jgi:hypothetical protein
MVRFEFLSRLISLRTTVTALVAVALLGALTACGGGSSAADPAPVTPTNSTPSNPGPVTGIALPSSVSVVTATNAS